MLLNDLTSAAMADAARLIGDGPVTMVNLPWFREAPGYEPGFAEAKPDVRSPYCKGYVSAFDRSREGTRRRGGPTLSLAGWLRRTRRSR